MIDVEIREVLLDMPDGGLTSLYIRMLQDAKRLGKPAKRD